MKPPKQETSSQHQIDWWSSQGIVYFIAAGNPAKAIKIGVAALSKGATLEQTVLRRLRQIQTSNHESIELIGFIHFIEGRYPTRDAEVLERKLHIEFSASQRFKANTRGSEWFTPTEELFYYIKSNAVSPESLGLKYMVSSPINR